VSISNSLTIPTDLLPLDRLDWAIAGTSSYSDPRTDDKGNTFTHARWEHWIDSRTREADGAADEGDNYAQTDGSTLEKGRMVNPATGLMTDYEELWRSPEIEAAPSGPGMEGTIGEPAVRCVVLRLRDDSRAERGMVVLLGQYCQGILREGDDLTIERWQWDSSAGEWKKHFKIGDGVLACSAAIQHAHELEKDTDILLGLQAWTVVELSEH
jgi:hypothetical protein